MRWAAALVLLAGCDKVFLDGPAKLDADLRPPACPLEFGDKRYLLITDKLTWEAAEARCAELQGVRMYSHLAVIPDEAELLLTSAMTTEAWVGLTNLQDQTSYRWITTEPVVEIPWTSGQPDRDGNCGRLYNATGIADGPCTEKKVVLCECDEFPVNPERF